MTLCPNTFTHTAIKARLHNFQKPEDGTWRVFDFGR